MKHNRVIIALVFGTNCFFPSVQRRVDRLLDIAVLIGNADSKARNLSINASVIRYNGNCILPVCCFNNFTGTIDTNLIAI